MTASPLLIREELASALRIEREAQGMSLRDLSAAVGHTITPQAISRIELAQRSPKVATLVALAGGLGATFSIDGDGVVLVERKATNGHEPDPLD
jgi:transcriptional regulator with XRE-family HTH domain